MDLLRCFQKLISLSHSSALFQETKGVKIASEGTHDVLIILCSVESV